MATTFGEIKRKILLRFDRVDGRVVLAVEEAINDAQKVIASVKDFDDLLVLDTTNSFTEVGKKSYHIENDLKLVRPKDIYSIRYMDAENSRKLIYVPFRELDAKIPYTEQVGRGRPTWYTLRGKYVELFRVPDAAKPLYIQHSQWPPPLTNDSQEIAFSNLDHVLVSLASDMAASFLEGVGGGDWFARARQLLGVALSEADTAPDQVLVAQPFQPFKLTPLGKYWEDPFVKRQPD